jgi:hypothetical protein
MSLLISETYANNEVPLWLDTNLASEVINALVPTTTSQTLSANGTLRLATITFPTAINYAKLSGWVNVQCLGVGVSGCSIYLTQGADTTWSSARGTRLTGITLPSGTGSPADTYLLLDNLIYFNNTPFTTLNLYISNGVGLNTTIRCFNATASNTYSSLPTISGWTCASGVGSMMVVGGIV